MADYNGRGFPLHYVEEGDGHPVVFAHGYVMDHTMFAPQFEDLPDRFRCVAWDMRGHGASGCPDGPWTMPELVSDLIAFIRAVGASPCHLVGMSIGGMLAIRAALRVPDLVSSLVLIDTSADAEEEASLPLMLSYLETLETAGLTEELATATLPTFYGDRFLSTETEAVAIHVRRALEMKQLALVETLRALVERDSVVARLHEIAVPALVIHGEQDAAIGLDQARAIAEGISGATLVTIPGAGHTPPLEAPDSVNQHLAAFLSG